jgi:hypothetical protein
MTQKLRLCVIIAFVLAASGIAAASASSPSASSSHRGDGRSVEVIRLVSTTDQESPEGDEAPALGDQFAFSDILSERGREVGILGAAGTVVRTDEAAGSITLQLVGTAQLPRGDITVQGLLTFTEEGPAESIRLAITGGTEAYRTARGEVIVTETEDEDTVLLMFVVIR